MHPSSSSSSSSCSSSFSMPFFCPSNNKPLHTAVACFPCQHRINEIAAERLYGKMDGGKCSKLGFCLHCKNVVKAYYPDQLTRTKVSLLLGLKSPAETVPLEEKKEPEKLVYPGVAGKFRSVADWNNFEGVSPLTVYQIQYISDVPNSLFTGFSLLGEVEPNGPSYKCLFFKFQKENEHLKAYLGSFNIMLSDEAIRLGQVKITGSDQVEKMLTIFHQNNEVANGIPLVKMFMKKVEKPQRKCRKAQV